MRIREAAVQDVPTVARLRLEFLAAHRGTEPTMFSRQFREQTEGFVRRHHGAGSARSWLATADGHDVGVVTMLLRELAPRPEDVSSAEGYIVNMYVVASARRRGIGRALLERCLEAATDGRLRRLVLHATDDGRPLYANIGFTTNPTWMELSLSFQRSP